MLSIKCTVRLSSARLSPLLLAAVTLVCLDHLFRSIGTSRRDDVSERLREGTDQRTDAVWPGIHSRRILNYPQVIVNSVALPTQANVESRWPDGSVKHAIISFVMVSVAAVNTSSFTFQNQLNCNCGPGARLGQTAMLGANFDFDAQIIAAGATASARAELTNWDGSTTGPNGPVQYWADGSISTTVILADHSAAASYDIAINGFNSLRPIFICTFWPGINKVRVRFVLENSNTTSLQDLNYAVSLTTGSSSRAAVYSNPSVPHTAASRWTKVFWIGGMPDDRYTLKHNVAYLAASAATPNYDTRKVISTTQLTSDYTQWNGTPKDIYQKGFWQPGMGTAGGRPDIGPFPDWVVRWIYTGDYRERQISLGNADLAPSWPVQIREGASGKTFDKAGTLDAMGRVLSISARPSVDFSQGWRQPSATTNDKINPVGPVTCFNCGVWKWDSAHLPDAFFIPYLLTGDFFYLEQSWFWASFSAAYPVASSAVNYGRGATLDSGAIYMGQERAEAWGLRERAETAWMSPTACRKRYC